MNLKYYTAGLKNIAGLKQGSSIMPLLVYRCEKCKYEKELLILRKEKKKIYRCPDCKIELKQVFSPIFFIFKDGFNTRTKKNS